VPWCAACSRFLSPPTVKVDGTCPSCGNPVDPGRAHPVTGTDAPATTEGAAEEHVGMPWHFWLLAAALAIYLGWRAFQGVEWVWHQVGG
jgi:hypothetical protein